METGCWLTAAIRGSYLLIGSLVYLVMVYFGFGSLSNLHVSVCAVYL